MSDNNADVGTFHRKFGIDHTDCNVLKPCDCKPGPRDVPRELTEFRLKFLLEELLEIAEAAGYELIKPEDSGPRFVNQPWVKTVDHPKLFDGLLDLAYVTFGMAHVYGYPWHAGWNEVQRANITKERCGIDHVYYAGLADDGYCGHSLDESTTCGKSRASHSLRGSKYDVIKPEGWEPPDIAMILRSYGWKI